MIETENRTNGRVLRLGMTRPERIPVYIGEDSDPVMAWVVTNGRYPVSVAAELDDARADYKKRWIRIFDGPPAPDLVDAVRVLLDATTGGTRLPTKSELLETVRTAYEQHMATPQWEQRETDYQAYVARVIMILAPGVEDQVVDMLSNDDRLEILAVTGYLGPAASEAADAVAAEENGELTPPDNGPSSTGSELVPVSASSTAE